MKNTYKVGLTKVNTLENRIHNATSDLNFDFDSPTAVTDRLVELISEKLSIEDKLKYKSVFMKRKYYLKIVNEIEELEKQLVVYKPKTKIKLLKKVLLNENQERNEEFLNRELGL